ncbi:MAG TPA: hypothetical protein VH722_07785 [Alphaproteobacteria bacterium]|jgi:hypothetical protein|nr:hypothetical protein [Alphaproteobacteria bacterium]
MVFIVAQLGRRARAALAADRPAAREAAADVRADGSSAIFAIAFINVPVVGWRQQIAPFVEASRRFVEKTAVTTDKISA